MCASNLFHMKSQPGKRKEHNFSSRSDHNFYLGHPIYSLGFEIFKISFLFPYFLLGLNRIHSPHNHHYCSHHITHTK